MLLALNESDELRLTLRHFIRAKKEIEKIEPKMIEAFSAVGRNPYASNLERILAEINQKGSMSKGQIVETMYHDIPNKQILDEILENLELMGKIRRERKGGEQWYFPA